MSNKHDLPPPEQPDWAHLKSLGYAPGGYMSRCHCCKQVVVGLDKRANTCRPCAEIIYAVRDKFSEHIKRLEAENAKAREIIDQLCACHDEPECPAVAVAREWLADAAMTKEQKT